MLMRSDADAMPPGSPRLLGQTLAQTPCAEVPCLDPKAEGRTGCCGELWMLLLLPIIVVMMGQPPPSPRPGACCYVAPEGEQVAAAAADTGRGGMEKVRRFGERAEPGEGAMAVLCLRGEDLSGGARPPVPRI